MAEWCSARGIAAKGHPLVWHEVFPAVGEGDADAEVVARLEERVRRIVSEFRGLVDIWDVVNEATVSRQVRQRRRPVDKGAWRGGVRGRRRSRGRTRRRRRRRFSTTTSTCRRSSRRSWRRSWRDARRYDAIGIQSHMHKGLWPLERVWETCEAYARFGLPLHFTEVTVLSGRPKARGRQRLASRAHRLAHDEEGRGGAALVRQAALHASLQPPGGGGRYVVGFQRQRRLAGRARGPRPQGHEPKAALRLALHSFGPGGRWSTDGRSPPTPRAPCRRGAFSAITRSAAGRHRERRRLRGVHAKARRREGGRGHPRVGPDTIAPPCI